MSLKYLSFYHVSFVIIYLCEEFPHAWFLWPCHPCYFYFTMGGFWGEILYLYHNTAYINIVEQSYCNFAS